MIDTTDHKFKAAAELLRDRYSKDQFEPKLRWLAACALEGATGYPAPKPETYLAPRDESAPFDRETATILVARLLSVIDDLTASVEAAAKTAKRAAEL